ncbi:MAG: SDR family NAD(P)-dependent oxidoreductase [Puniceicoccales bacterium]
MSRFAERFPTAFVTGGSSGLGRVLVEGLLAEGVEVWAGSRSAERVESTGLPVHPVALDLADREAVSQFVASPPWQNSPVLLINNAGFGQFGRIASISPEDLANQVAAMQESAMKLSKMFLDTVGQGVRAPAVVNVSSLSVEFPLPFLHGYNAVKAGLSGFSRSLAIEFPGGEGQPFILDLRPGDYRTGFNNAVRGPGEQGELAPIWDALEHHLQQGADPQSIWPPVRRALLKQRSRTVRVGTFFQAKLAPVLARLFPEDWVAGVHKRYYGIKGSGSDR